ncbi:MAG: DUF2339 domain-containing protein [Sphingorhabdus sp.]
MTSLLLFALVMGLGLTLYLTRADLKFLHRRIDELEARLGARPAVATDGELTPVVTPVAQSRTRPAAKSVAEATVITRTMEPAEDPVPEQAASSATTWHGRQSSRFADFNFEKMIGGQLPIWVGGIALVFAAFFLVRYTIEAGLFGPGARSIAATIFALAMIAISEFAGRLPGIGASFTADKRIGQSLAGAGVATLYGTLYMASEIYGLVSLPTSFALLVLASTIAFALSLRHGPPTALMGLIGGFAAPWVAGMDASSLPTLLLYLSLFIAALFGLAIWRRWLWLLVLASVGGTIWTFAMLLTATANLSLLGGFITLWAIAALLGAKRIDENKRGWSEAARFVPVTMALVQLAILLPLLNFSVTAWLFYAALCVLTVTLAWRDKELLPLVGGALALATSPLWGAWAERGADGLTISATLSVALLFGIAGQIRARRPGDMAGIWAAIGLAAPILCWFSAIQANASALSNSTWSMAAILAAIAGAFMAWDQHARGKDINGIVQWMATAATALMTVMACALLLDEEWSAIYMAVVALCIAAWAQVTSINRIQKLVILPLGLAMLLALALSHEFLTALGQSLSGRHAFYDSMPRFPIALQNTLVPALLMLAITWQPWFATGRKTRITAYVMGTAGVMATAWLAVKLPAAIATPGDFIRFGFAERAMITQGLFGLGLLALSQAQKRIDRHAPGWPLMQIGGWACSITALFRVIWFDLLLLNPLIAAQAVGPVPVANLLTCHAALCALWLWMLVRYIPSRFRQTAQGLSLGMMIVTVLASIRQMIQGNLVSGAPIGIGENYLYSAGLLALALTWLVLGLTRSSRLLRIAGLSLLTAVTLKVFLVDAAALTGLLRILSFLGLGIALIGIGWAYGRIMGVDKSAKAR